MKTFRLILCFYIIFSLVSCGKNELVDLSGFIYNYNTTNKTNLSLNDFIIQKDKDTMYTAVIKEDGCDILLSLTQERDNKIGVCKIALVKDISSAPNTTEVAAFNSIINNVLASYCCYNPQECENIIDSFKLNKTDTISKNGELTLKIDNHYFVYYTTEIISEFSIYNTYIKEIESTQKPVSKPYYGEDFIIKDKETP